MTLEFDVSWEARGIAIAGSVAPGEVVALLGPNGAGKTSLLELLAGLAGPDRGFVRLAGKPLVDTTEGQFVPVYRRRVALLAQDPLLFDHLNVLDNVAFGPRARGVSRRRARAIAAESLAAVGVPDLASRGAHGLSGGQAQRVAIARSLAGGADLVLLDEPVAALDVAAAAGLRPILAELLRGLGVPAIVVTHDLLDVIALADTAWVLEGGRLVERGPVPTILGAPRSDFGARFAGVNLVRGTLRPDHLEAELGNVWGHTDPDHPVTPGPGVAVFSPSAVAVHPRRPEGSARNVFEVRIAALEPLPTGIRVRGVPSVGAESGLAADVTAGSAYELGLQPGQTVFFAIKSMEVTLATAADRPAAPSAKVG